MVQVSCRCWSPLSLNYAIYKLAQVPGNQRQDWVFAGLAVTKKVSQHVVTKCVNYKTIAASPFLSKPLTRVLFTVYSNWKCTEKEIPGNEVEPSQLHIAKSLHLAFCIETQFATPNAIFQVSSEIVNAVFLKSGYSTFLRLQSNILII